ncbi:hypothetical protein VNO77_11246 [Canavalia gladiata]|uniref:Uncharacterized protein n=1 Tax=Canavalia gladiata TaxID=3824 RepID=A0AAN9QV71_CANGL
MLQCRSVTCVISVSHVALKWLTDQLSSVAFHRAVMLFNNNMLMHHIYMLDEFSKASYSEPTSMAGLKWSISCIGQSEPRVWCQTGGQVEPKVLIRMVNMVPELIDNGDRAGRVLRAKLRRLGTKASIMELNLTQNLSDKYKLKRPA